MTDQTNPMPAHHSQEPCESSQPGMPFIPETWPTQPRRRRRRVLIVVAAVALALLATGIAFTLVNRQSPLEAARQTCGAASDDYARLGDDGSTLTLRSLGKETSGLSLDQLECYWSALEMPDSVRAEVEATRALDGRRSGEWDEIRASWSYHPDSGVQMVFTLAD
ncbi:MULTISPECIES: hypothetical protein [unclassified Micromonospora]|uniref:hypothetical protein n=1 Tax=unclassified Micromonospora TaxID=2617518 RepID=UPI0033266F62